MVCFHMHPQFGKRVWWGERVAGAEKHRRNPFENRGEIFPKITPSIKMKIPIAPKQCIGQTMEIILSCLEVPAETRFILGERGTSWCWNNLQGIPSNECEGFGLD